MLNKLSVAQKGLLLVSIPVLFELLFAGSLYSLLDRAKSNRAKYEESKDILLQTLNLESSMFQSTIGAFGEAHVDDAKAAALKRSVADARKAFREGVVRRPDSRPMLDEAYRFCDEVDAWVDKAVRIFKNPKIRPGKRFDFLREDGFTIAAHGRPIIARIIANESKIQVQAPARKRQDYLRVVSLVVTGIIVNATMAIFLAAAFGRDFIRRLRVISQNALSIIQDQPLVPLLESGDEIASLDAALHAAADKLHTVRRNELAILENAADVICSVDAAALHFITIGSSARRCWGLEPESLANRDIRELMPAPEKTSFDRAVQSLMDDPGKYEFDGKLIRGDQSVIDVRWTATLEDGDSAVYLVARDITEMKELERLRQRFVATINHDIRTPLTSVNGALELTLAGASGVIGENSRAELEQAARRIEDLTRLINLMLDLEKHRQDETVVESVCSLLDMCELAWRSADSPSRVVLPYNDSDALVDQARAVRALDALIRVAVLLGDDSTPVRITAAPIAGTPGTICRLSIEWKGTEGGALLADLLLARQAGEPIDANPISIVDEAAKCITRSVGGAANGNAADAAKGASDGHAAGCAEGARGTAESNAVGSPSPKGGCAGPGSRNESLGDIEDEVVEIAPHKEPVKRRTLSHSEIELPMSAGGLPAIVLLSIQYAGVLIAPTGTVLFFESTGELYSFVFELPACEPSEMGEDGCAP